MAVLTNLSRTWQAFKRAKPGERFRNAQRNRRRTRKSKWSSVVSIIVGIVVIAIGLVATLTPGPGGLVVVLGAALISRESAVVAKAMDKVEVALRVAGRWCQRFWKRAHWTVKVLLVLVGTAVLAAACYGAWLYYDSR
jgi:hypothetical protein